jgi:membrane fusion protein (multidrug efflux system)
MKAFTRPARLAGSLILFSLVAACSDSEGGTPSAPAMPPPAVSFVEATPAPLAVTSELPGRVAPTRIAEVRPRISGIIVERVFEQGSVVAAGDVLYRIDAEPFRVQVESAKATLMRAEASQLFARQQADRQQRLHERRIASEQQQDSAITALAQADADVAAARAGLDAAQLNLEYAEVKAPIAGRIGRAVITEGALVSGAESLATVQQIDPVYVDFTQSSSELMRLRQALDRGVLDSPAPGEAAVKILMDDGSAYAHAGRLLFSEATVDPTTGQVMMRAEVPNPDGHLLPGLYVRILIEQGVEKAAIAIPQQAIQRDAGGNAFVYVVNAENVAEVRQIRVGRAIGDRAVIDHGLNAEEKIVVEGFQKMRPGAPVNPQAWNAAGDETTPPATADDKG